MKIVYLVGSVADSSVNRRLANAIVKMAPKGVEMVEANIKDLPMFDRDLEDNFPEPAAKFKELVASADGVLFVTPEHNRMFSALIHNAVEWTSRPYGDWALAGKPVAVTGASISGIGTAVAQQHLRSTLAFFGPKIMTQPEAYVDVSRTGIIENGEVTEEGALQVIGNFIGSFVQFIKDNQ